jgi:hypothetical protein
MAPGHGSVAAGDLGLQLGRIEKLVGPTSPDPPARRDLWIHVEKQRQVRWDRELVDPFDPRSGNRDALVGEG